MNTHTKTSSYKGAKGYLIWLIALFSIILRSVNINSIDMVSDDAHYAFRALGWFDYLGSSNQTTPVQWFGKIPWWGNLSFHDAPPLGFFVQKVFFTIFGDSLAALRLPGIIEGAVCVVLIYFLIKKFKSENTALLGGFIYAISSAAIWMAVGMYLETTESVFIVLALLALANVTNGTRINKWLYFLSFFLGMSLLSKYTAIFLIPMIAIVLLVKQRKTLTNIKPLLISAVILIATLLPVIIYNTEVYRTRGHFDAALSSMVGEHPQDFSLISGRSVSLSTKTIMSVPHNLYRSNSPFLLYTFAAALLYLLIKIIRKKADTLDLMVFTGAVLIGVEFAFSGATDRYLTIIVPFTCIAVATFSIDIYELLRNEKTNWKSVSFAVVIGLILVGELVHAVNTSILDVPFSTSNVFRSSTAFPQTGMDQFEKLITDTFSPLPARQSITTLDQVNGQLQGKSIVFYDDRIDWFRYMWYIAKYQIYYKVPVLPVSILLEGKVGTLDQLVKSGTDKIYFVYLTPDGPLDSVLKNDIPLATAIENFKGQLDTAHVPEHDIKNPEGVATMEVYEIK